MRHTRHDETLPEEGLLGVGGEAGYAEVTRVGTDAFLGPTVLNVIMAYATFVNKVGPDS
jgi:hypothetical protein